MKTRRLAIATGTVLLTGWMGCGSDMSPGGSGGAGGHNVPGPLDGLQSIDLSPSDATIYVTDGVAGAQDYKATGHFADGTMREVTNLVAWSIEDIPLAFFPQAGHLVAGGVKGGQSIVHATTGSMQASGTVKVVIRENRVIDTAPADSSMRFGGNADATRAPTPAYPADGVLLPPNLGTVQLQWQPASGTDLFVVDLTSPFLDLHIYTEAMTYTPTAQEWTWLSETHRGGQLTWQVRATAQSGGGVGTSGARGLKYSKENLEGAIYYWSSTRVSTDEGIWRFDFGSTSTSPEKYLAQEDPGPANVGHCVGCHVLSRDGTKIAFTYESGNGAFTPMDVATRNAFIPYGQIHSNFETFNPEGTQVVTTYLGTLTLRNVSTGVDIRNLPTGPRATHPDWSPDGNHIVYAAASPTAEPYYDWTFYGGSLEIMDQNAGMWSAPRTLVAAQGTESNYYPQFSPDGEWIVFTWAPDGLTYANPMAEAWITRADGSGTPTKLAAAHDGTGNTDSWPRWSPFVQMTGSSEFEGPLMWITISSQRAYGVEVPAGSVPQLWMFAFSTTRAMNGQDGSFPAFWLPFQNTQTHNHIAQWTTRAVPVPIRR